MANTYTSLYYHVVFSTRHRVRCLDREIEARVWAYIGGVARKHRMTALRVGGYEDPIHSLITAPPSLALSQAVQFLKGETSRWMHEEFPELSGFAWQDGYGAFSVGKSNLPEVVRYIQNQREHHRKRTFQEEYLEFLRRHGIEYDERYVWG